jgi:hypothetical protein
MVMDAILVGLLENSQIIEDGICQNYVRDLYSVDRSPIFRTTVVGKLVFSDNDLETFHFCNMGGNCYQPDCSMSKALIKIRPYKSSERFEDIPRYTTVNQILEQLFKQLQIKKEGVCQSYMRIPESLPSEVSRLVSKYKVKIGRTPTGNLKVNIFYGCNVRNSCYQKSCSWSGPSVLESSLIGSDGIVSRLGFVAGARE